MATFSASSVAAAQRPYPTSHPSSTDDSDETTTTKSHEPPEDDLSHATAKLSFADPVKQESITRPRKKSLQEKYHPVDAAGKPLHAKIAEFSASNPHHTHLDLHHPSPVRTPSPSRISVGKSFLTSKLGKTEKMKIDKYEDGKRHILVGATGSVASVKIPLIVKSLLAHEEVEVQVVVTKTAKHFFDVEKLKSELNVKVWEDEDDWKVNYTPVYLEFEAN
jgi:Flavoprotein